MTDRELMQQALNVLKSFVDGGNSAWARKIIEIKEALRDRLAQPEEPDWSAAGFSKPPTHSEAWWKHEVSNAWAEGYEKGRASVKQPEQEPVWVEVTTNTGDKFILDSAVEADKIRAAKNVGLSVVPLYTKEQMKDVAQKLADCAVLNSAPPQREWQGLTDDEILEEYRQSYGDDGNLTDVYFAHAIEAKLKEKNHAV